MYGPQLEKITVAAPCTAEWRWMYGNDRVRFCSQCKLNVYNLSAMTREQAEDLIRNAEGRLCVRFYRRKDGTMITQNCPQGLAAVKAKFNRMRARVAAFLLTFLGSIGILGLLKLEMPAAYTPVMGGMVEKLPVGSAGQVINPPEMGELEMPQPVVERSEKFIRERAIFRVMPVFHSAASAKAAGSEVVVNINISPDGEVSFAESIHNDSSVREMAIDAALRWKFQPMKEAGMPATVRSRLTFSLIR